VIENPNEKKMNRDQNYNTYRHYGLTFTNKKFKINIIAGYDFNESYPT